MTSVKLVSFEGQSGLGHRELDRLDGMGGEIVRGLRDLSDDIGRWPMSNPQPCPPGMDIRLSVCTARRLRELRKNLFGEGIYSGPAWDLLLQLFESYVFQRRETVKSMAAGTGLPMTTAIRWLYRLEDEGLAFSRGDQLDGRKRFVELSELGASRMTDYFSIAVPQVAAA